MDEPCPFYAQALEGDSLVFVVALRNLLAYSSQAKVAAARTGLHSSLMHCCLVAATMLGSASAGGAAAGRGAGGDRSRAGGAPSAAPSRRSASASSTAGPRVNLRGHRVSARSTAGGAEEASAPATPHHAGAAEGAEPFAAGAGAPAPGTAHGSARKPAPITIPASPSKSVISAAVSVAPSAMQAHASAAGALPQHPALEKKVTVALSLLKHLAYRSPPTRTLLVRDGLLDVLRKLWKHGFKGAGGSGSGHAGSGPQGGAGGSLAGGSIVGGPAPSMGGQQRYTLTASPALHELLGLLTNMVPECPEARAKMCGDGSPSLLQSLLSLMFEVGVTEM